MKKPANEQINAGKRVKTDVKSPKQSGEKMKRNEKARCSDVFLSAFVDEANEAREKAAMEKYFDGPEHRAFLHADHEAATLRKATDELALGNILPRLKPCYSASRLVTFVTAKPEAWYDANKLRGEEPDDDCENPEDWVPTEDMVLDADELKRLRARIDEGDGEVLADVLASEYDCPNVVFVSTHAYDAQSQKNYRAALAAYAEAAATRADALGAEDACLGFLDVLRILEGAPEEAEIAAAFETFQKAQADLWRANRRRTLKTDATERVPPVSSAKKGR